MSQASRAAAPSAVALVLLAAALVAVPALVPGDGLRWRPAPDGLRIVRVLDDRDLAVGPGARIVSVNSLDWRRSATLRAAYAPADFGAQGQYVIHENGFEKRRIVALRPLPLAAAVRGYVRPAILLLFMAALALGVRRDADSVALLLAGTGIAVYTLGNASPLTLRWAGLRHLELAVGCWTSAGALLLARAARRGPALAWVAGSLGLAVAAWLACDTRWIWWRAAVTLDLLEVVVALTLLALHQRVLASLPGGASRGPSGNAR